MHKDYRSKQYRKKFEKNEDSKITHTSYTLYYHLVWSVKKRFPLITESVPFELEKFVKIKCRELDVHLLEIGINQEHVHAILSLKPAHYIPEIVKQVKGFSVHEINKTKQDYIKWTRGYSIRTISKKDLPIAIGYVKNQRMHHVDIDRN